MEDVPSIPRRNCSIAEDYFASYGVIKLQFNLYLNAALSHVKKFLKPVKNLLTLIKRCSLLLLFLSLLAPSLPAQCMTYPVPFTERATQAEHIVLGRPIAQTAYWDAEHRNIYTLTTLEVTAWLKGYQSQSTVGVISLGGTLESEIQVSLPALKFAPYNEYVVFLKANEASVDNREIRRSQPQMLQALPYADVQGALTKQAGRFHDLHHLAPETEANLLTALTDLTGEAALTPGGNRFLARPGDTYPLSEWAGGSSSKTSVITSFSPNPTHAGTIAPTDFITIDGNAFGASPGTVFYANANDGGATLTASGVATDNVSWSATQIVNKPAGDAGTGAININGTQTSATSLTINYAHIDINSNFSGFAQPTRQRYNLADVTGAGTYFLRANANISGNAAAIAAFTRAAETWRCATGFNLVIDETASTAATIANDGENSLLFDATLPNGVLGRATSRFQASATAVCNTTNTVWWTNEIDLQFKPNPPSGGTSWNFGPGPSAFTNFDFESVVLHEVGHAHGLGHVIDPGAVMHFAIANGQDSRALSTNDVNGGLAKMVHSTQAFCFTPGAIAGPITANTSGCAVLPTAGLSLSGQHHAGKNFLEWVAAVPVDAVGFQLERSIDGQHFTPLAWIPEAVAEGTESTYHFADSKLPAQERLYYRVVQEDRNGAARQSNILALSATPAKTLEVFPTLVDAQFEVHGQTAVAGQARLQLIQVNGQILREDRFSVEEGSFQQTFAVTALPKGLLFYRISLPDGSQYSGKLLKQ